MLILAVITYGKHICGVESTLVNYHLHTWGLAITPSIGSRMREETTLHIVCQCDALINSKLRLGLHYGPSVHEDVHHRL